MDHGLDDDDVGKNQLHRVYFCSSEPVLRKRKSFNKEAHQGRIIMDKKLYSVGVSLELCLDQGFDDDDYLSQDVDGKNILHIAIQHHHKSFSDQPVDSKYTPFVKEAIERYPKLMYQKDCNGDTPLHIAARLSSDAAKILLEESLEYWNNIRRRNAESADVWELDLTLPPWKVKNWRGHTPIHDAACSDNCFGLERMIDALSTRDQLEALSDVNEYGETAFHLIARSMNMADELGQFLLLDLWSKAH